MDRKAQLFSRVKDSTENLSKLIDEGLNFPVGDYIDAEEVKALAISLSIGVEDWQPDDLEKILFVRDGLYELRHHLRDRNDTSEHSIDQVIALVDRVYVDLEFALRAFDNEKLKAAQSHIAVLQRGAHIEKAYARTSVSHVEQSAKELLVQTNTTYRKIEINIFKLENSSINIDVLKKAKLQIQRLSASVFAIKLSLEQNTIFQGVFQFLNESADRVIEELKSVAETIKGAYEKTTSLVEDLKNIAEKGGRFTKQISNFLKSIFDDDQNNQQSFIKFRQKSVLSGPAALTSYSVDSDRIFLGCRNGHVLVFSNKQGRVIQKYRPVSEDIHSITQISDERIALGTEVGLDVFNSGSSERRNSVEHASAKEKVTASALLPDERTLITGSREGKIRKWSVATSIHASTRGFDHLRMHEVRAGRNVKKIIIRQKELVIGSQNEIRILDYDLQTKRTIQTAIQTEDMLLLNDEALLICGSNQIAHINLDKGIYSRLLSAAPNKNYTCISMLTDKIICAGTSEGEVLALNLESNEEVGVWKVGFHIRSITCTSTHVFAAGGAWHGEGNFAALLSWEKSDEPTDVPSVR